jgi:hypothetical protein
MMKINHKDTKATELHGELFSFDAKASKEIFLCALCALCALCVFVVNYFSLSISQEKP